MELWQAVLVALGGNAAILLVLGYLGRSLISTLLAKDVEKFKIELQAASQTTIERVKAELHLAAIEHEVRFSRLHEKRAEILTELYRLLVFAMWEAESFAMPMDFLGEPDKEEKFMGVMKAIAEFYRFFDQHRIFIPHDLGEQLTAFIKQVRERVTKYGVYVGIDSPTPKTAEETMKIGIEVWEWMRNEVPTLRKTIEDEFRTLLGALPPKARGSGM